MKKLLALVLIGVAEVPVSFVVTLLLFPFWSWLEASTGIESVGHSGPADWCFITVFGATIMAGGVRWFFWRRKRATGDEETLERRGSST